MKNIIFLIITLCALSNEGISQQLLVVCEPGYRVYIDDTLKGVTNDSQDGLLIDGVAVGEHELVVKKRTGFTRTYTVDIREGMNELIVEIDKSAGFPRKDGYYISHYMTKEDKALFSSSKRLYYHLLYMGADDPSTKTVEFEWIALQRYEDEGRNHDTFEDIYNAVFLNNYRTEDLEEYRWKYLFTGLMKVTESGLVSVRMNLNPKNGLAQTNPQTIIGNGRILEDSDDFVLYLRSDMGYDKGLEDEFTFRFVPMPGGH